MPSPPPSPLPENAGLAFIGEAPWPKARLTARQAAVLEMAGNATGRPNADVIRRLVGFESGHIRRQAQVDFPLYFNEQEASLYAGPFETLRTNRARSWLNPHAIPELRTALSKLDRYLATPLASAYPDWNWLDSELLPDATLLAVAREDDFIHGVLRSRCFNRWWHTFSGTMSRPAVVTAFPFPWPPSTLLGSLSREQEEQRHAVARAVRTGDQSALDTAVANAYRWADDLSDDEVISGLTALNGRRSR